jgi:hypothetical protein
MNLYLILFLIGAIMITAGYTNQISPQCNKDMQIKIVPRDVYDEIILNRELSNLVYKDM